MSINSLNMVRDASNDESLEGHNINSQLISDNEHINVNDDTSSEVQHVDPFMLSE